MTQKQNALQMTKNANKILQIKIITKHQLIGIHTLKEFINIPYITNNIAPIIFTNLILYSSLNINDINTIKLASNPMYSYI